MNLLDMCRSVKFDAVRVLSLGLELALLLKPSSVLCPRRAQDVSGEISGGFELEHLLNCLRIMSIECSFALVVVG